MSEAVRTVVAEAVEPTRIAERSLLRYKIHFNGAGTTIDVAEALDTHRPVEFRRAWVEAILALARENRTHNHQLQLANMRNHRVGKQTEEGLEDPDLDDVAPPPLETFDPGRMVEFSGRADGSGYACLLGNTILAIECLGPAV